MASNSFQLKGWSVVLVSALFALAASNANTDFVYLALLPAVAFWILDGYFLQHDEIRVQGWDESCAKTGKTPGQLLAENVEALGLAYAFDSDADGELETLGGNVIWAVDTTGDNQLDRNLDTNGDGVINMSDDTTPGNGVLEGVVLGAVPLADIRAVKIWILARTDKVIRGSNDTNSYVVGRKVVTPSGSDRQFKRRLLTTTVRCRNLNS